MKRIILAFFCFFFLAEKALAQQDSLPRVSDFVKEIQQADDHNHRIALAFWIPWQYWEAAVSQSLNGKPLTTEVRDMINSLRQYTMVWIVDGKIGPYGVSYRDEQSIRDSIRLVVNDSVSLRPLEESTLNENMRNLVKLMGPVMSSMFGQMGDHLVVCVFENTRNDGKPYISAENPGKFSISWRDDLSFSWRLPLDVLTPPKYCPVDGEKLSGKFEYCPYHGRKLKTTK